MLFQLPILLPEKFPARSSKPVIISALLFQRLKALLACFPPVCQPFLVTWCEITSRRSRN